MQMPMNSGAAARMPEQAAPPASSAQPSLSSDMGLGPLPDNQQDRAIYIQKQQRWLLFLRHCAKCNLSEKECQFQHTCKVRHYLKNVAPPTMPLRAVISLLPRSPCAA